MPAVELFNKTCYPDEVLLDALKYAKRKMGVKGDVAVKVVYKGKTTSLGQAACWHPSFEDLAGKGYKKYADKKYYVKGEDGIVSFIPRPTKNNELGYVTIYVDRPPTRKYIINGCHREQFKIEAKRVIVTMLHEMGHIWQFRNQDAAIEEFGSSSWDEFYGWNPITRRSLNYRSQPIEIHVRQMIDRSDPTSHADKKRRAQIVENMTTMFEEQVS